MRSAVYQATCSPFRNPLDSTERRVIKAMTTRPPRRLTGLLARGAGAPDPAIRWRLCEGPYFDNQVGTLRIEGRACELRLDKTKPGEHHEKSLDRTFERDLAYGRRDGVQSSSAGLPAPPPVVSSRSAGLQLAPFSVSE